MCIFFTLENRYISPVSGSVYSTSPEDCSMNWPGSTAGGGGWAAMTRFPFLFRPLDRIQGLESREERGVWRLLRIPLGAAS